MAQGKKHIPTDETRQIIRLAAGNGVEHRRLPHLVGLSDVDTLYKYYREECDAGIAEVNAFAASKLQEKIREGDTTSLIFYLKTKAGFKDQSEGLSDDVANLIKMLMEKVPS